MVIANNKFITNINLCYNYIHKIFKKKIQFIAILINRKDNIELFSKM